MWHSGDTYIYYLCYSQLYIYNPNFFFTFSENTLHFIFQHYTKKGIDNQPYFIVYGTRYKVQTAYPQNVSKGCSSKQHSE